MREVYTEGDLISVSLYMAGVMPCHVMSCHLPLCGSQHGSCHSKEVQVCCASSA